MLEWIWNAEGTSIRPAGNDNSKYQDAGYQNRNDLATMSMAETIAKAITASKNFEGTYIATDAGDHCHPRFDIKRLPQVGDPVSYGFNGDAYPCGHIASISKTLKVIVTDGGHKFYRVRQTGCWRMDGTWSLIGGHVSKQNPHF